MTSRKSSTIFMLFTALVAFHLAASWGTKNVHILPDEASYLAQARYFAGQTKKPDIKYFLQHSKYLDKGDGSSSTKRIPYYHFGYSLLVSPVYWFSDSPASTYRGILILNSFMLSTLFLVLYAWLRTIATVDWTIAAAIAFITSLYPPYVLHAQIGWAENALIPGFALSCLLLAHYLKYYKLSSMILFAIVAGYQYTLHPRGLAAAGAAVICLLILLAFRKIDWRVSGIGIAIVTAIVAITKIVADDLTNMMNAAAQGGRVLSNLSSLFNFELFTPIVGNILFMVLATLGLFLLGTAEMLSRLFQRRSRGILKTFTTASNGSIIYILLASGLTLGASIVFLGRSAEWHETAHILDFIMYGRYNDVFLSLFIALGLLWLTRAVEQKSDRYSKYLRTGFWVVASAAILFSLSISDYHGMRAIHTYGLYAWSFLSLDNEGWLWIAPIFIAPLVWTWLVLQLFLQNKHKGMVSVGIYFFLLDISLIIYSTPSLQILGR